MRVWPRVLGRLLLLGAGLWVAYIAAVFPTGEPTLGLAVMLVPPIVIGFATLWIAAVFQ